jgi:hypothetical protein
MRMIAAWPVVIRDRIVHAFKPGGSPTSEAPFRTLRRHEWVSQGVRVTLFADRGLAGQMTFFSSLNVVAARLARRGNAPAAARVARAAADLEAGPEFAVLRSLLSQLPDREAEQVVGGLFPEDGPAALAAALRAAASRTEQVRANDILLSSPAEVVFAGRIAEVTSEFVLLVQAAGVVHGDLKPDNMPPSGRQAIVTDFDTVRIVDVATRPTSADQVKETAAATMVPLWMAGAARRDQVGDFLVLVADKLDGASAVVEAVPAIDIDDASGTDGFSPFGRNDARTRSITADDVRLLAGEPRALRVLVPVTING